MDSGEVLGQLVRIAPWLSGVLAAALSLLGSGLYLLDIRRGRTRPHLVSWLIWSVIALIAVMAHRASGGRWGLLALGGQAATTCLIAGIALAIGVGGLSRTNLVAVALATAGILGWLRFDDPVVATACVAAADAAGLLAIVPKYWADPHSETPATYALAGASGLLAGLAVFSWDLGLLLFPGYYCVANAVTASLIWLRRRAARKMAVGAAGAGPVGAADGPCLAQYLAQYLAQLTIREKVAHADLRAGLGGAADPP